MKSRKTWLERRMRWVNFEGEGGAAGGASDDGDGDVKSTGNDFLSSLPEDIRSEPSLQTFSDASTLAKSYVNAQKMIGADKIIVPRTDEEWDTAYNKLGRPETSADYALSIPDEYKDATGDFTNHFRELGHKLGFSQKQMEGINDWYWQTMAATAEEAAKNNDHSREAAEAQLKELWGEKYEGNLAIADRTMKAFADGKLEETLEKADLLSNPVVAEFLAEVGNRMLSEDELSGVGHAPNRSSPEELRSEISAEMAHPAYTDKKHPQHKTQVAKVQSLFGRLHG